MRIFIFSDWQEQPIESIYDSIEREETVDAIVYGGDNLQRFYSEGNNKMEELAKKTRIGKVLAVRGNMDKADPKVFESEKVQNLHQEAFQYNDISFLGLSREISFDVKSQEEQYDLNHLKKQYSEEESRISVLVSHTPPDRILDIASKLDHKHIGSKSVRKFIEQEDIELTICGHCHQFGGRAREKDFGTVINIASTENPKMKGRYGIVKIKEDKSIEYDLKTTKKGVENELLDLSQVGEKRLEHFQEKNITELDDIKEENRDKLKELPGIYEWHVNTWIKERKAIIDDGIAFANVEEFRFLRDKNLILFDIETKLGGGKTWLIGLYSYKEDEFTQIFEKDNEKELLKEFIEYVNNKENPRLVYYSNCRFDAETLRSRMIFNDLENHTTILDNSVDLGIKVQNYLLGGFRNSNLKDLSEQLVNYEFTYDDLDGFDVGKRYSNYLLDGIEPDWDKLLKYNEEDVMSLQALTNYLKEKLA